LAISNQPARVRSSETPPRGSHPASTRMSHKMVLATAFCASASGCAARISRP